MRTTRHVIPFTRPTTDSPSVETRTVAMDGARTPRGTTETSEPAYGSAYLEWRHWAPESFGALSVSEEADFAALLRKAGVDIPEGSRVLEVGFGNGAFLQFGRRQKWKMRGTEVNRELLESAYQKGFQVTESETLETFEDASFEMVAAFDVMQHIPLDALPEFLSEVCRVLKPGGVYLARFPNGDSPFGRHIQNGNLSHRTAIGSVRARYLALQAGMDVEFLGSEVQAIWAGRTRRLHRLFEVLAKGMMNSFLNLVFSPQDPLPFCSLHLELVARKPLSGAV